MQKTKFIHVRRFTENEKRLCPALLSLKSQCAKQVLTIMVNNFASLFTCLPVGRASDSVMARHKAIYFSLLGLELFCLLFGPRDSTVGFLFRQCSSGVFRHHRDLQVSVTTRCFWSPHLCFFTVFICDLFVFRVDPLMS